MNNRLSDIHKPVSNRLSDTLKPVGHRLPLIPRGCFLVLRTNGTEDIVRFPDKKGKARRRTLATALGFDTFEVITVSTKGRYPDLVMVINDLGYETKAESRGTHIEMVPVKARFPVNRRATDLYHITRATTHKIVGDAAVMHEAD